MDNSLDGEIQSNLELNRRPAALQQLPQSLPLTSTVNSDLLCANIPFSEISNMTDTFYSCNIDNSVPLSPIISISDTHFDSTINSSSSLDSSSFNVLDQSNTPVTPLIVNQTSISLDK